MRQNINKHTQTTEMCFVSLAQCSLDYLHLYMCLYLHMGNLKGVPKILVFWARRFFPIPKASYVPISLSCKVITVTLGFGGKSTTNNIIAALTNAY